MDKRRGHDLLAEDLDGDGKVDLVMRDQSSFGSQAGHSILLYKQGSPTRWTSRELRCAEGEGIRLADIILAPAELQGGSHRLAWYQAPANPQADNWK